MSFATINDDILRTLRPPGRVYYAGLALALIMRLGLLMLIGWLVTLQTPIFDLGLVGTPNAYGEPSFETALIAPFRQVPPESTAHTSIYRIDFF